MKTFKQQLDESTLIEPIEINFADRNALVEAALHPGVEYLKMLMTKKYGLSFKVEKIRDYGVFRYTAITKTGVEVGYAEHRLENISDPNKKTEISLFGSTSGMFLAHGIDPSKKEITNEFNKKFGKDSKAMGKEWSKTIATSRAKKK